MAITPTPEDAEDERGRLFAGARKGAVGGLLATVTMTVYRLPIAHSLPPTREFWAQYGPIGGDDPGSLVALVLHFCYGAGGGVAFGAAFAGLLPGEKSDAFRETAGLAGGVLYGAVLSLFGSKVLLNRVLSMDLERDERLVFHVGHLVYALTLGTWVGSRTDGDDSEG